MSLVPIPSLVSGSHKMASSPPAAAQDGLLSGFPPAAQGYMLFHSLLCYLRPSLQIQEWDSFLTARLCKRHAPVPPRAPLWVAPLAAARWMGGRLQACADTLSRHGAPGTPPAHPPSSGEYPLSEAPAGLPITPPVDTLWPRGRRPQRCGSRAGLASCEPNTRPMQPHVVTPTPGTPSPPSPRETTSLHRPDHLWPQKTGK